MQSNQPPYTTLAISLLIFCYSSFVSLQLTGSLLGDVKITQLEIFGGVSWNHLQQGELWRFITAQFIHAKAMHMLYNTTALLFLGWIIEPRIGPWRLLTIWLLAGGIATVVSSLFGNPPWNLGTGASQAVCALAGFSLIVYFKERNKWLLVAASFALIPALGLDLITAAAPKPGHSLGVLLGIICYFLFSIKPTVKPA